MPWTNESDRQTDRREMFFQCHCIHFTKYDPTSMIMNKTQRLFDLEVFFRKYVFKVNAHPLPRSTYGLSLKIKWTKLSGRKNMF